MSAIFNGYHTKQDLYMHPEFYQATLNFFSWHFAPQIKKIEAFHPC